MRIFLYDPKKDTKTAWENEQRRNKGKKSALTLGEDEKPEGLSDGRFYVEWPLEVTAEDKNGNQFVIEVSDGALEIRNTHKRGTSAIHVIPVAGNVVRIVAGNYA